VIAAINLVANQLVIAGEYIIDETKLEILEEEERCLLNVILTGELPPSPISIPISKGLVGPWTEKVHKSIPR
jgi:hypothetical protein